MDKKKENRLIDILCMIEHNLSKINLLLNDLESDLRGIEDNTKDLSAVIDLFLKQAGLREEIIVETTIAIKSLVKEAEEIVMNI